MEARHIWGLYLIGFRRQLITIPSLGDKELLHTWISESEALELNELTSFLNGIKKDMDAVENACTLPYNNGLAEGSINKLKTIKRIMYGRNSFGILRNKLLLLESRKFN